MASIKIRFNTQYESAPSPDLKWRLLVDGVEMLASEIAIEVPARTTEDVLPSGIRKWHLSCEGTILRDADRVTIV